MADATFFPAAASWLLTYGIHSTILLIGAWLLTGRWAVRSIVARDAIWKVALVGGVLTASFQVAVGYEPYSGRFDIAAAVVAPPVAAPQSMEQPESARLPGEDEDNQRTAETVVATSPTAASAMDQAAALEFTPTPPPGPTVIDRARTVLANIGWLGGLLSLWGIGASIGLARFGVARMKVARLLGDRRDIQDPDLLNMLHTLRQVAGLRRRIRLTWSATVTTPVALHSEICLPKRALAELSREHHRGILAHEVAHIARRDPTWIGVGMLVQRILFLQPLNALARRRVAEIAEYLCDDWAVTHTGTKLTFAESLAEVATWISKAQRPALLSTMAEDGSQLVRRVERILDVRNSPAAWTPHRLRMPTAALALLAVGGVAPGVWYDLSGPVSLPLVETTPIVAVPIVAAAASERIDDQGTPEPEQEPTPELANEMLALPARVEDPAPQLLTEETPVPSAPSQPWARTTEAASATSEDGEQQSADTVVVYSLIRATQDEEANVRTEAVAALGQLASPLSVPALITALQDENGNVRYRAAEALGKIRDPRGVEPLAAALADSSPRVRQYAAASLGRSGDARAHVFVGRLLNDESPAVRRTAVRVLGRLKNAESVDVLTAAVSDGDDEVRVYAIRALGELAAASAVLPIINALGDDSSDVARRPHGLWAF